MELPSAYSSRVRAGLLKAHFLALKTQPCQEHVHTSTTGSARTAEGEGPFGEYVWSWALNVHQPAAGQVCSSASLHGGAQNLRCPAEVAEATAAGYI